MIKLIISLLFILLSKVSMADSHDKEQNIIEKAKNFFDKEYVNELKKGAENIFKIQYILIKN